MRNANQSPTTLAVDKDLHKQVKAKAEELGFTTLEYTNELVRFGLQYCEIERPAPIVRIKQPV